MSEDQKLVGGFLSGAELDAMLPEASTEELIAAAVARAPHKHSAVPEARMARALRGVIDAGTDNWLETYESRVREIGGDPEEMLPGNKPRYTMGDGLEVKDHMTGTVYTVRIVPEEPDAGAPEDVIVAGSRPCEVLINPEDELMVCGTEHVWQEPVESNSKCIHCGLPFGAWANS